LKKYNYGKQISAIEKHVFIGALPADTNDAPPNAPTQPRDITGGESKTTTPMLTMETSSPQSSSLPSTDVSTVDGPAGRPAKNGGSGEKEAEVCIEGV
jgi:mRNA-binding protein PUF3